MIVQQTQNAFNDKMAQFILIPLGGALGFLMPIWPGKKIGVEDFAALLIPLPFVLFAPLAGWISDRFSKRMVLFYSALVQVLVLTLICTAVWLRNMPLALCGFFALAVQSTFFSPAKMGLNKELLGSKHLGFATAVQQMLAMLAILTGQIVAGKLFDDRLKAAGDAPDAAWQAAFGPLLLLSLCAIPALGMAWIVPVIRPQSAVPFRAKLLVSHFGSLRDLWSDSRLRSASFGVAFFWGFAAYLNLWSVKVAKVLSSGGEGFGTLSSLFMAAASLGMAFGFGFASWLMRRSIQLGWVPVAGFWMAVCSIGLAVIPIGTRDAFLPFFTANPASVVSAASASPSCAAFLLALGLLAFFSALFLAPLNAWMQDRYPADKRGGFQSAVNLQDCFAGIFALLLIIILEWLGSAIGIGRLQALRPQMLMVATSCLLATILIIRVLPADFLRLCCISLVRILHKTELVNGDRLPAREGALLLPNHVTYADSFYLSASVHRPLRFVMDEVFTKHKAIRVFTRIFDTVNIRHDQPIEAIRTVIDGLSSQQAMVLFPEGQLTRTGALCPLQRGFELIARKAKHPVIPVWMDGTWGTSCSFEGGRFFGKAPRRESRRLVCALGEPIEPKAATVDVLRDALLQAASDAITHRFSGEEWTRRVPTVTKATRKAFSKLDPQKRRMIWANGHQIAMIGALSWRQPWFALEDDPCVTQLLGLFAAFPQLSKTPVTLMKDLDSSVPGTWVGGDLLRLFMDKFQITANLVFHDFSEQATRRPLERAGLIHCPALSVHGRVIAMSMPDPPPGSDDFPPQLGHRRHSWGRLLPGWVLEITEEYRQVIGPAAPEGLVIPDSARLDETGFLNDSEAAPKPIRYGRRA